MEMEIETETEAESVRDRDMDTYYSAKHLRPSACMCGE